MNSNLFGCGLNLQITTDILFLHKTEHELQSQIIGRAQRPGRKNKLAVWFLMHENEHYFKEKNIDIIEQNNIFEDFKINIIEYDNDDKVSYL